MSNPITLVGTVATTPKLMRTQTGVSMCTFRLASSERRYDRERQEWIDGETNWFSVSAFRSLAEHAQQSFTKGERIILSGRLRVRRWEQEEKSGTNVEVEADALGHDLRWGVSRFTKTPGAAERVEPEKPADSVAENDGTQAGTESEARAADGFLPAAA